MRLFSLPQILALIRTSAVAIPLALTSAAPEARRGHDGAMGSTVLATSFEGEWMTPFGPMSLRKKGRQIMGTCGYDKGIKLSGKAKGKTEWLVDVKGHQRGDGTFTLWKGGDQFSGTIALKAGGERQWRGYRLVPELPSPKPGKITSGQSESGLHVHLRVPKGFKKNSRLPAIALLHGSNMSAQAYVNTFARAWPDLAKAFILVGFDGENLSGAAKPGQLAFNYSYVNFSGPGNGPAWAQRQSPALVTEAMDELAAALPIQKWIVGGHSQGGFLTYAVAMFYPEKVAGAFPMSCGLLVQCEPDNFNSDDTRAAQRRVAFAPIHATNDGVVGFSGGRYGYWRFADEGFPALRFFTDDRAAHMFARLPVDDAVRWIDALTDDDPKELIDFADERLDDGDYRDACAALHRLVGMTLDAAAAARADKLRDAIDAAAAPRAEALTAAIRKNASSGWIDDFFRFRHDFEFARAAEPVLAAYAKLRKKHAKPAQAAFSAGRNAKDAATRNGHYREIVEKHYASKWFIHAREWIK